MTSKPLKPVRFEDGKLLILDQSLLPGQEQYIEIRTAEAMWNAIRGLQVRGAPTIGVAAAFGLYVALRELPAEKTQSLPEFVAAFRQIKDYLATARPTAVNLFWALERMERCMEQSLAQCGRLSAWEPRQAEAVKAALLEQAKGILYAEEEASAAMGEHGLRLLRPGMGILTHCNAGALAAPGYGTCLAPIYLGQERGYAFSVYADETRPLLQGARLTAWELMKAGVDVTLICDNMAATVMKAGKIQAVVVGCDRMAANGDGANKIGTSAVAVLAKEYGIPFYMFVPTSTIDMETKTGAQIKIEERDGGEITDLWYRQAMAPAGVKTFNPAFDVTEHPYITAVITEKGVVFPPYEENLRKLCG